MITAGVEEYDTFCGRTEQGTRILPGSGERWGRVSGNSLAKVTGVSVPGVVAMIGVNVYIGFITCQELLDRKSVV